MSLSLPSIMETLQGKNPFRRRLLLEHHLHEMQVTYREQEFSLDYYANILVDIPENSAVLPRQHLSCYYDRDGDDGSDPNDGATATTVLLGLVERYATQMVLPSPLRFLFLDGKRSHPSGEGAYLREERTDHHRSIHLNSVNQKIVCYLLDGVLQCQVLRNEKGRKEEENYLKSAVEVLGGMIQHYSSSLRQTLAEQSQKKRG